MTATIDAPKVSRKSPVAPTTVDAPVSNTPTVGILAALDAALTAIKSQHSTVPQALAVVIASGGGKKHGHFAPGSWVDTAGEQSGSARHEILMSSESLSRGAMPTLTTLIHECAHARAHNEDVQDTSRQGRYHNVKFRDMAQSMGLVVEENPANGHITTGLMSWAEEYYAPVLTQLEAALTTHRKPATKKPAKVTTIKVACECVKDNGNPASVTVPIKWYDEIGRAMCCGICDSELSPVD